MPIVTTTALPTDLLYVMRGQYRPRVTVSSFGSVGRVDNSTLVIETRTDDPATPEEGQIWLRTDL